MTWKELDPADIPAAAELNRLAGWNQTERDWAGYLEFAPGGCQGAVIDGRLAGTFTTVSLGKVVGWIGMVLVHPDFRRRGLGTALLRRAIGHLQGLGVETIGLDATEAGRRVYLPLGFRDEYCVERMEGVLCAGTRGAAAGVGDPGHSKAWEVEELDRVAFGAPRETVLRALRSRDPQFCFADGDGYLIAREGRQAVQVGPWVARDFRTAERLMGRLAAAAPGRRAFLDVPSVNPSAAAWLRGMGFMPQRSFMRMTLGGRLPAGRDDWIFGTAGAEKG